MSGDRSGVRGALLGLTAAALFGVSAPLAKLLLPGTGPVLLAGLLYLGAGLGLTAAGALRATGVGRGKAREARLTQRELPLLLGVILFGGVLGPVAMLSGLSRLSGVEASLLLNLEAPFTILLAIAVFGEHLGRRALLAVCLIVAGAGVLQLRAGPVEGDLVGGLWVAGGCLAWAADNNLTQRLSLKEPVSVVRIKALGASACMLVLALASGDELPPLGTVALALIIGAVSYGISIVLDLYALRLLGAAREAAFFATAPFIGALAAVPILGDRLRPLDFVAAGLMAAGVVFLVRERHGHGHTHEPIEHDHLHVHDEHHRGHGGPETGPHSHPHRHAALTHDHPHASDLHHRHRH